MTVQTRRAGAIAYVTLDNPPVNANDLSLREGLRDAVDWVEAQDGLSRVVLTGAGHSFAAGAQAQASDDPHQPPHLHAILDRIEASRVPWIAAINGAALGAGCEVALACRMRIARPGAEIGLPDVRWGVIPGAGGTQRLPRLIGFGPALGMIATGNTLQAEEAVTLGLIDGIADDPVTLAAHLEAGTPELATPVGERAAPVPDVEALAQVRETAAQTMPRQIAPLRAIELVELSTRVPLSQAMKAERETCLAVSKTAQAQALRHILLAQRAASVPDGLPEPPAHLDHVAVVGGGITGVGITSALLGAGARVTLLQSDADSVERAGRYLEQIITTSLAGGLLSPQQADLARARCTVTADYSRAAGAGLAIEAADESMQATVSMFKTLETHLPQNAILATTSACVDMAGLAQAVTDPTRLLGLHFYPPAHRVNLLEIIRAGTTGGRALATGIALAGRLGAAPVLAATGAGAIGNRILARYSEAADTVFMDGSTPWEVDEAMVAFGFDMGPYEAQDLSGLDAAYASRSRMQANDDPARRRIPLLDRMLELGKLGRKTGAGWYRYPGGKGKVEDPIVADLALEESHFEGRNRTDYSEHEIQERLLAAMINEAADILWEGGVQTASDLDLLSVLGLGFPRWRGGLLYYADTLGAAQIVATLDRLAQEDALVWAASPLLRHCAQTGTRISQFAP